MLILDELKFLLKENSNIPSNSYSLEGGLPNEALCLSHKSGKWEVYYSEKGKKTDSVSFQIETEACEYFYSSLTKMLGIKFEKLN